MKIALASFCVAVLHLTQAMWFNTASKNNFLDEMAHVQNMSQWCKLLNIEDCEKVINSVPTSLIDENGKVLERFENDFTGNVPEAELAACSPSLQTVMMPKRPEYSVWPPCTRALRCSGCCTNVINSCQPLTTSEKQVKAVYIKLQNPGDRHAKGDIDISLVSITEHENCIPQCKTKEEDCHTFQEYEPNNCRCVCRPERKSLRKTCKGKHIWDEEACNCVCVNMNTKCPSSSNFSTETCRCQLKSSASGETYISQLFKRMKIDLLREDNLKENQHVSKEIEVKMVAGRVTVFGEGTLEENVNAKNGDHENFKDGDDYNNDDDDTSDDKDDDVDDEDNAGDDNDDDFNDDGDDNDDDFNDVGDDNDDDFNDDGVDNDNDFNDVGNDNDDDFNDDGDDNDNDFNDVGDDNDDDFTDDGDDNDFNDVGDDNDDDFNDDGVDNDDDFNDVGDDNDDDFNDDGD